MKKSNLNEIGKRSQSKIQNCLYLLPKLKSYSQNQVINYETINKKKPVHNLQSNTITSNNINNINNINNTNNDDLPQQNTNHNNNKCESVHPNTLSLQKYKYISRSPNYFKRISRSNHILVMDQSSINRNQPIQDYVGENRKKFDKTTLMNLINDRRKLYSTSHKTMEIVQPSGFKKQKQQLHVHNKMPYYQKQTSQKQRTQNKNNYQNQTIKNNKPHTVNVKPYFMSKNNAQKALKLSNFCEDSNRSSLNNNSIQFNDTSYSKFVPNRILGVKNNIRNLKHPTNLKLNLNQLY